MPRLIRAPTTALLLLTVTLWSLSSGVNNTDDGPVQLIGSLCPTAVNRIKNVISKAWMLSDPMSTGYSVLTYGILGVEVPKAGEVCKYLQTSLDGLDGTKVEPIFVISSAIGKVPNCKVPATLKPAVRQSLEKTLQSSTSPQDIFYAIHSARSLSLPQTLLDPAKLSQLLKTALKSDDSPQSIGYALWASALTHKQGQKVELLDRIEDVVAQADEVDKLYLQFEGGLSVTAAVINGVVRVGDAGKTGGLSAEQVVKFGNYLVSRRTVTTPRGSWLLASALEVLSSNKHAVPVYIGLVGSPVLTDSNKNVVVKAVDLLGRAVDVTLMLESLTERSGKAGLSDVQFIQGVQDAASKTQFKWELKSKPIPKGFYDAVFSAKSTKADKALILVKSRVELKVIGKLGAVTTRVGVADSDQQSKTTWNDLNNGQKLPKTLELEPTQKLIVKVGASDELHQVFVLLRGKGGGRREVAFIAQVDGGSGKKTDYKLELDLTQNAKDLAHNSGTYELILVLGDFLIEDSIEWNLGEVSLVVAQGKGKEVNPLYSITYGMKGEIRHEFRTPDPRPPRVLSDAFTMLVLVPLLVLLVMWLRLGANVRNLAGVFVSAVGFHVGLAGLFGVYAIFWLRLTMFEALKWMSVPALVTFISGHRMLSQISERRKGGGG